MAAARTISLKGRGLREELKAGGTITPGHLIVRNASDAAVVHPTAGARTAALFAVENDLLGKDIDDNYVSGDFVQAEYLTAGMQVYALVAAAAVAITKGDLLVSAGDGTLKKYVAPLTTSVGTGDGTIADVGGAFSQTTLNNNFKDVADAVNANATGNCIARALETVDNSGGGTPVRLRVVII